MSKIEWFHSTTHVRHTYINFSFRIMHIFDGNVRWKTCVFPTLRYLSQFWVDHCISWLLRTFSHTCLPFLIYIYSIISLSCYLPVFLLACVFAYSSIHSSTSLSICMSICKGNPWRYRLLDHFVPSEFCFNLPYLFLVIWLYFTFYSSQLSAYPPFLFVLHLYHLFFLFYFILPIISPTFTYPPILFVVSIRQLPSYNTKYHLLPIYLPILNFSSIHSPSSLAFQSSTSNPLPLFLFICLTSLWPFSKYLHFHRQ